MSPLIRRLEKAREMSLWSARFLREQNGSPEHLLKIRLTDLAERNWTARQMKR
jgi:hypothetical protein